MQASAMVADQTSNERAWIEAARGGDAEALGHLYERYSDRIYRYALLKVSDPTEAEDITEQVFLKMIEAIDRFEWQGATSFVSWLLRIAHNQAMDTLRRSSRRAHVPLEPASAPFPSIDGNGDPHYYAEKNDFLDQLRSAMGQLTNLQAQVIALKFGAGMSNAEVAEALDRTINTVNATQYSALKKLQKLMVEKGYKLLR